MITEFLDSINPDLLNWILLSIPLSILIYTAIVEMIKYRQYLKQFNPITEMKLELKHLAPYLPYGLKIKLENFPIGDGIRKLELDCGHDFHFYFQQEFVKPILRPLSEAPIRLVEYYGFTSLADFSEYVIDRRIATKCMDELIENHFDVFSLIPAGLAIDANTLNL